MLLRFGIMRSILKSLRNRWWELRETKLSITPNWTVNLESYQCFQNTMERKLTFFQLEQQCSWYKCSHRLSARLYLQILISKDYHRVRDNSTGRYSRASRILLSSKIWLIRCLTSIPVRDTALIKFEEVNFLTLQMIAIKVLRDRHTHRRASLRKLSNALTSLTAWKKMILQTKRVPSITHTIPKLKWTKIWSRKKQLSSKRCEWATLAGLMIWVACLSTSVTWIKSRRNAWRIWSLVQIS